MRIEGVALEDHGHVAVLRVHVVRRPRSPMRMTPDEGVFESGHQAQHRRLAASGGPEERQKFAGPGLEGEIRHGDTSSKYLLTDFEGHR